MYTIPAACVGAPVTFVYMRVIHILFNDYNTLDSLSLSINVLNSLTHPCRTLSHICIHSRITQVTRALSPACCHMCRALCVTCKKNVKKNVLDSVCAYRYKAPPHAKHIYKT